jgi:hypothetical protein
MPYSKRNFSSNSVERTLGAVLPVGLNTLTLDSDAGLSGLLMPFTLVIDPDISGKEEIITVLSRGSGNTWTVNRGSDGTVEVEHNNGAKARHMITARDLQEPQNHIVATGPYAINNPETDAGVTTSTIIIPLHGIGIGEGSVVGTDKSQVLTNKSLTSPTITGTITGQVITSANIVNNTIVNENIAPNANIVATKLTGTTAEFNTALSDGNFATIAGTEVLTGKTLTSPVINGTVTGTAGFGAWAAYTPVWGSNGTQPVLGNSTISGFYTQIGKTVHYRITLTLASGGGFSVGVGSRYTFTLPVTGAATYYPMATGFYHDSSVGTWYPIWGRMTTTSIDTMWIEPGPKGLTSGTLGSTLPVVPATGDIYFLSGTYEAA